MTGMPQKYQVTNEAGVHIGGNVDIDLRSDYIQIMLKSTAGDVDEILNEGQHDQCLLWAYRRDWRCTLLVWCGYLLTGFLLRLLFHWRAHWGLYATHQRCSLSRAEYVLLYDQYGIYWVQRVKLMTKGGSRVKIVKRNKLSCCKEDVAFDDINVCTYLSDFSSDESLQRYFMLKKLKYLWNVNVGRFELLSGLEFEICSNLHQCTGLSSTEALRQRFLYGANRIVVPVTPILKLFFVTILNPFYIFQVFSITLWYIDEYWMYATCIVIISVTSAAFTAWETHRNEVNLRNKVEGNSSVSVCRSPQMGEFSEMGTETLVPGDIIEIPRHGCFMHCDAVLLNGNCIVNEASLTGESMPLLKTPLPNVDSTPFQFKEHSRHVLFCGTNVIQTRYLESERVRALVLRTGYLTAKGEMVRSIMFPKPIQSKFDKDAAHYILLLGFFALLGFIYTVVIMAGRGYAFGTILVRSLDLVTIVVPPALPAAMTVGVVFAVRRLKQCGIFCISPNSVNLCGVLDVVCFDKTGTLTEDGLDMWGVLPVQDEMDYNTTVCFASTPCYEPHLLTQTRLLEAMAVCHSLTYINKELSGDPLDLKMFMATGWILEEPALEDHRKFDIMVPTVVRPPQATVKREWQPDDNEAPPYEIGVVRQLTFSSSLQRSSVVARVLGAPHFDLYTKGSPEMVASLCRPETLPEDFTASLMTYTRRGFRVLALAWRPLKCTWLRVQKLSREDLERDLKFLGLVVLENRLKDRTTPIIQLLCRANIRPKMVTGDNMLTAISVARDCHMIAANEPVIVVECDDLNDEGSANVTFHYADDLNEKVQEIWQSDGEAPLQGDLYLLDRADYHLAMSGKTWAAIMLGAPHLLPRLVVRGTVFARFSPDQKAQLVEALQKVGYMVGMCGDGANDCGALKMAHAGIALSDAEASVASPFTSRRHDISCVPDLIREGRCALTTSFGIFKFMAGYSLTQFMSCLILYSIGSNLSPEQFLYIDMLIITTLSITFGRTSAYEYLHPEPPSQRLVSLVTIFSISLQMLVGTAAQLFAFLFVCEQPWFTPYHMDIVKNDFASYENTAVFIVSSFQYTTLAVVFSKSSPYRKTIFSNWLFFFNIIVCFLVTIYTCLYPFPWLFNFLKMVDMPRISPSLFYKLLLLGVALAHFFLCFALETLVEAGALRRSWHRIRTRLLKRNIKPYRLIEKQIVQSLREWPRINRTSSFSHRRELLHSEVVPSASGRSTRMSSPTAKLDNDMENSAEYEPLIVSVSETHVVDDERCNSVGNVVYPLC